METHRNLNIGFCLLPSELIHYIIIQLALPDIIRLKSVSKSISSIISDKDFVRDYNVQSSSATWLFIYKKRWHRDALLHGFADCSNRWFKIIIADMLKPIVPPGEDLYFLTASGNFFLFALNTSQEVISVNPVTKTVKKIPPSPLGPRGTSSWRRSGMKLLSYPPGSCNFRFLFAEMHQNRPMLFEYDSKTDKWQAKEGIEDNLPSGLKREEDYYLLSAYNGLDGSVIIAIRSQEHDQTPIVLRPRFARGQVEGQLGVGFSWGNLIDRLHVYGDGNMMIIRSNNVHDANKRIKMIKGVELWGMSLRGTHWEYITKVPCELIDKIKKPYGAMMGCLQQRDGIIRAVLMSNMEGSWDIIWLCYDIGKGTWTWLPLPDCNMKGSNMAGITFSSGLTLS